MAYGLIGLVGLVCAVWVIYDVWTKQKKMDETTKVLWTVIAIVFSILTAILYYLLVKNKNKYFAVKKK